MTVSPSLYLLDSRGIRLKLEDFEASKIASPSATLTKFRESNGPETGAKPLRFNSFGLTVQKGPAKPRRKSQFSPGLVLGMSTEQGVVPRKELTRTPLNLEPCSLEYTQEALKSNGNRDTCQLVQLENRSETGPSVLRWSRETAC
jgi:hypothetical protein